MDKRKENIKAGVVRLQKLKDAVISKYLDEIDLDSDMDLYDQMINHFTKGELDDVVKSSFKALDGLSPDEANDVLELAREYQGLCFYDSDPENWLDSIENMPISDYDLATYRIFENYDFLLDIAKSGGRGALEQLNKFKDMDGYAESAVVEYLRNNFGDDRILKEVLLGMSDETSLYQIFTDGQKASLLSFPKGTLYFYGADQIKLTSPLLLSMEIYSRMNYDIPQVESPTDVDDMVLDMIQYFKKDVSFDDVVMTMEDDYNDTLRSVTGRKPMDMMEVIRDVEGHIPYNHWNIENSPILQFVDTPYHPENTSIKR